MRRNPEMPFLESHHQFRPQNVYIKIRLFFFAPICLSLQLLSMNLISYIVVYSPDLVIPSWSSSQSALAFNFLNNSMSSANPTTVLLSPDSKSFMNIVNSAHPGPNSCVTHLLTSLHCKIFPFTPTFCFLLYNHFLIHEATHHIIPWPLSLLRSPQWGTLSKAFLEVQVYSIYECSLGLQEVGEVGRTSLCRSQADSICFIILSLIVASTTLHRTVVRLTGLQFLRMLHTDPFWKTDVAFVTFHHCCVEA